MTILVAVGVCVGVVYGLFGAGASAFATPVLAVLGVPPVLAVASPLPATIPAALAGAWSYFRSGELDLAVARRAVLAGVPAAILGAVCSHWISGPVLLLLSGVMLLVIGARLAAPAILRFGPQIAPSTARSGGQNGGGVVVAGSAAVGFAAGLLANSGGFLLVPLFLLVVGLGMRAAAGTSLLVAAALSVPTLITHWMLGNIDWRLAAVFAVGLVPGSVIGSRLAHRLPQAGAQRVFGAGLALFAVWFVYRLA